MVIKTALIFLVILLSISFISGFDESKFDFTYDEATGSSSNITNLDDLEDVNAGAPGDGEVLTWDDAASRWISQAIGAIASIFNQTYHDYAYNVSTNWTEVVFDTYNSTWDDEGSSDTFNQTYHDYATNVSLNWSENTFGIWGEQWYNYTTHTFNLYNSTWDNRALVEDKFNQTYHDYATNVSLNETEITYNLWNTIWSSVYNATYHLYPTNWNSSILQYLNSGTNESYLSTFNQTYHDYAINVSTNWTEVVFDTYNSTWDDEGS